MSTLYIDVTNGISADMLVIALKNLGAMADVEGIPGLSEELCGMSGKEENHASKKGEHAHEHSHTSYQHIIDVIENLECSPGVKGTALNIYEVIARAEAKVHGATLKTVHFHEVGRPEALKNILTVSMALEELEVGEVLCSPVHDGCGTIYCSHGEIPVPVPAVKAMMETCDFTFVTDDVETEMVTPSGLGILIGIGARCEEEPPANLGDFPVGIGVGTRDTGRDGLKAYLIP